jgi:altronate dehydratase large subunit
MRFRGYRRNNGSVGVRNLVAVITTTGCINEIPKLISRGIPGAIPLGHNLSCSHLGDDLKRSTWILTNLVGNPNIFGAVLVGMGCEQMSPEKIYQDIQELDKPVELLMLKEVEDWDELVRRGRDAVHRISEVASKQQREEAELGEMSLAIKCGGSDTTSGVVSNPVAGFVADRIISEGGTVVFTETPEILGAEHVLAKRAINKAVAERVLAAARNTERRVMEMGVDLRGSEPTPANIAGGLTTIEEKSLGAIIKAGSTALQGVLDYGERPSGRGLFFMDGPARTAELLVGIAAAGCQVMVFSMGGGLPSLLPMLPAAPARFPLMPVIKMSGNPDGHEKRKDLIDIYVGNVIDAGETIEQAGDRLLREVVSVASGQKQTIYERGSYEEPLLIQIDGPSL